MSNISALQTSQKRDPASGPPFNPAAAVNWLSVDPVSGKIVYGNDTGAAGDPGQALSDREIVLNGFLERLVQAANEFIERGNVLFFGGVPAIGMHVHGDPAGKVPVLTVEDAVKGVASCFSTIYQRPEGPIYHQVFDSSRVGEQARLMQDDLNTGFSIIQQFDGTIVKWIINGSQIILQYDISSGAFGINTTSAPADTKLAVAGGLVNLITVNDHTADYALDVVNDSGKHLTNRGAVAPVTFTLPTPAVIGSLVNGLPVFEIEVYEAQNVTIVGDVTQTIRIAAGISLPGGTATSNIVGSVLRLQCISATEFVAVSSLGVWVV